MKIKNKTRLIATLVANEEGGGYCIKADGKIVGQVPFLDCEIDGINYPATNATYLAGKQVSFLMMPGEVGKYWKWVYDVREEKA